MQTYTLNVRPRRQITLPRALLETMGIDVGDQLKAVFKKDEVVLKPQKQVALDAFVELQKIIKDSGVRKSELQASIDRQRQSPAPDGTGQGKL